MNRHIDTPVRRRSPRSGRRGILQLALAPACLLILQACGGLTGPGGPAGHRARPGRRGQGGPGDPPGLEDPADLRGPAAGGAGVPVRVEPSAAEIRAEKAQDAGAQDAGSVRDEALLDTYWKLIELGDRPVVANAQQREPHLILHREASRVTAHGGCNRLSGSYRLAQDRLTFGTLLSTRMACDPRNRQEALFAAALAAVAAWRVEGPYLEFFDDSGKRIARFEVRHL